MRHICFRGELFTRVRYEIYLIVARSRFWSYSCCQERNKALRTIMTERELSYNIFSGTKDRFNGITVDSEVESCDKDDFIERLKDSLKHWSKENIRAVWFKVALQQAEWIPILAKNGFTFHHSQKTCVSMVKWLPVTEAYGIPEYAHTMIGVGAIVVNGSEEILVIRERFGGFYHWKLPGGYVEPGEDIQDAAMREVLEETNIQTEFKSLICFRHAHHRNFDCSDIYFIASLTPVSESITKCDREIEECKWMKVDDFMKSPDVIETNRFFVKKFLECKKEGFSIGCIKDIHPLLKKPQCTYSIENINEISCDSEKK